MKERQLLPGRVTANPPLNDVAEKWLASIEVPKVVVDGYGNMVAVASTGGIRRQTWDQYEGLIYRLIEPALGALKINEITTSTCDSFLKSLIVDWKGHTNARLTKTVLKQIMSYAIRHDLYVGGNPVREVDRLNRPRKARGLRALIADRMDVTLECIRRHYAGEPESPLADVINAYADFFALFEGFKEFVEFFHFQDLVTPDYEEVQFYLPFDNFKRSGMPATKDEYVTYREATLEFIAARNRRMAAWVRENRPGIEVRQ